MFKLKEALKYWKRKLRSNPAFEDGDIAELESHLLEEIEHLKAEGLSEEDAFKKASQEIGDPEFIGDELYKSRTTKKARRVFSWKQKSWMFPLLSNYLKVAGRNLMKNIRFSLIKIGGLSIGIVACLIIALYIQQQWSYDHFHEKSERIYRLTRHIAEEDTERRLGVLEGFFASNLPKDLPEVESAFRIVRKNKTLLNVGDVAVYENQALYTDPSIFDVLDIITLSGSESDLLEEPGTIVITESLAEKMFGNENAIGKNLYLDQEEDPYRVNAVVQDFPDNSHISFEFLLPMPDQLYGLDKSQWSKFSAFYTYILLHKNADPEIVASKIPTWEQRYFEEDYFETHSYSLQPLTDIHLYSDLEQEIQPERIGKASYLYIFGTAALLILMIAVINHINLVTVKTADRTIEIGVRKALGAGASNIRLQFLMESILVVLLATVIALLFCELFLNLFNDFLQLSLEFNYLENFPLQFLLLAIIILTVLLSGIYPSVMMSGLLPSKSLKGRSVAFTGRGSVRMGMVIFQFCISFILILSTLVIWKQLDYVQNNRLGLNKDRVISLVAPNQTSLSSFEVLKQQVSNLAGVEGVTASMNLPSRISSVNSAEVAGDRIQISNNMVDDSYFEVLGIELVAGNGFGNASQQQMRSKVVVNESFLRSVGWNVEEAIGKDISMMRIPLQITGVARNFQYESLREKIAPQIIQYHHSSAVPGYLSARFNTDSIPQLLSNLRKIWDEIYPSHPFEYFFLDDSFAQLYSSDQRLANTFSAFGILAIVISILGLLSLVQYSSSKRSKEIGIRKVLGASTAHILILLSGDFIRLVILGCVIALPVAWIMIERWLYKFAYRVEIGVTPFLISGVIVITITMITVLFHSYKTAGMNPVKSLKNE